MALRRLTCIRHPVLRCVSAAENVSAVRHLSCTQRNNDSYKVVVVGGGAGGCATAAKFCRELGKGKVAVIEPSEKHSYQPMWTLVGAGLKTLDQSQKSMSEVLPADCSWVKEAVERFDPKRNTVTTTSGKKIQYEYLVVATGLQLNYDKVKGLQEALKDDPAVCSNYHQSYVGKTFPALKAIEKGNAIFTFPNTPVKCAGAPQKIMYLAEEIFRNRGVRGDINVIFNTSLPVIFGVKKYAHRLEKIIDERDITVNYRHNLVEVNHHKREATFQLLDSEAGETVTMKYNFLHATPPMSALEVVKCSPLVNEAGWVDVDMRTLQHVKFPNVFALGDCTSLPTSKTAAAVAAQCGVLKDNLCQVMHGKKPTRSYDGYTSCPLVTGRAKCILAEFDYNAEPLETFPFDQGKERRTMMVMKSELMPSIYWSAMMKGLWRGPAMLRKVMHLGMGR